MVTSRVLPVSLAPSTSSRRPLLTGSIGGVDGRPESTPLSDSFDLPTTLRLRIVSFAVWAGTGVGELHGQLGGTGLGGQRPVLPSHRSGGPQKVPAGCMTSGGQVTSLPLHTSARSHGPTAGRQTKPAGSFASAGHAGPVPLHVSAMSQGPAAARQTVPAGWNVSVGQLVLLPVQYSATSHGPAAARQSVPAGSRASAGQRALWPLHFSTASHGPTAGRHTVPAG